MPRRLPAPFRMLRSPRLAAAIVVLSATASPAWANFELAPRPGEAPPATKTPTTRPAGDATPATGSGGRPSGSAATRPAPSGGTSAGRPGKSGAGCNLSEQALGTSELRADGSCR